MNRSNIDTHKTHIHCRALSCPDTGTVIKSGNFKFVKPLFIDDAYLGIVAQKLKIVLIHEKRFSRFYTPDKMGYLFTSHGYKSIRH
jgi:hypothetical protein